MDTPYAALKISSVLSRSFSITFRLWAVVLPIALIGGLPVEEAFKKGLGLPFGGQFLSVALGALATGAIACATLQFLQDEYVSLNESVTLGASRMLDATFVSILIILAAGLGLLLLIAPGIYLLCRWAPAVQACALENRKVLDSLKRSAELTAGHRWQILGIYAASGPIAFIAAFGLYWLLSALVGLPSITMEGMTIEMIIINLWTISAGSPIIDAIITAAAVMPALAFENVVGAVVYFDLRNINEGQGLQAATAVFD